MGLAHGRQMHPIGSGHLRLALWVALGLTSLLALACVLDEGPRTAPGRARERRRAGAQVAASGVPIKWESPCKLGDWVKLGRCKHGLDKAGCAEGYEHWFASGCLCNYEAYPWSFLPKDITPIGFTWSLMKANVTSYAHIASASGCMESEAQCRSAREGDVRLTAYGHGVLEVFVAKAWRVVVGRVDEATSLLQCQRLGAYGGMREPLSPSPPPPSPKKPLVPTNTSDARPPAFAQASRMAPWSRLTA